MPFNWRICCYSGLFSRLYCHDCPAWSRYTDSPQADHFLWYAPNNIYSSLLPSGLLNFSSLITACETKDKNTLAWFRTVSFYLYAQFLLVSPQGDADMRIISILEQVEIGANPMPVILAETIIGLDNFKEQNCLSGSLLLLQVCNQNLLLYFYLSLNFYLSRPPGFST